MLGAEDKAGKSWSVLDLAVSVATGTPWLEYFPCPTSGGALVYAGEGGERAILRRLEAIIAGRGGTLADLDDLRICLAVPRLSDAGELTDVEAELADRAVRLVVLDPLYLAAAGAKGSDLYGMGEVLGRIQHVCQQAGAALALTTHWNKSGEGSGAKRFTGVGPGAWGRVLGSAAVERRVIEGDGGTDVRLRWEFTGSEIPDVRFRMRRRVRAEDPSDLDSPLSYEVEVTPEEAGSVDTAELSTAESRILAALESAPVAGLTVREVGDRLAADGLGPPLTSRTIQRNLADLLKIALVDGERGDVKTAGRWWRA